MASFIDFIKRPSECEPTGESHFNSPNTVATIDRSNGGFEVDCCHISQWSRSGQAIPSQTAILSR